MNHVFIVTDIELARELIGRLSEDKMPYVNMLDCSYEEITEALEKLED